MKAYFHKSYILERDNISKILTFVTENPTATRREISQATGIGTGKDVSDSKLRPTIHYAIYSGLLEEISADSKKDILFTDVGKIIFESDNRLKLSVTQWIMHYFLCRTENEALIWSFFVHEFLPRFREFDYLTLREELKLKFPNLSERNIKENQRILTSCYTNVYALSKIRLIESYEKDKYIRGSAIYPNSYLAAYILAEIWEAKHADKSMVEPTVLRESGHFATTMSLTGNDLQNCLDEMSAIDAIGQRRDTPPFQVVRRWSDKFDLLRRAYEVKQ